MDPAEESLASPSYVLVNQQLQDLVRIQNSLSARLRRLAEKKDDSVPMEEYERVVNMLEEEKLEHLKTKAALSSKEEQLEFALSEIEILNKQIQRGQKEMRSLCERMEKEQNQQVIANQVLEEKCTEMSEVCLHQDDVLAVKDAKLRDLKTRLQKQKQQHRTLVNEMELKLQQERYLIQNLEQRGSKKNSFAIRRSNGPSRR